MLLCNSVAKLGFISEMDKIISRKCIRTAKHKDRMIQKRVIESQLQVGCSRFFNNQWFKLNWQYEMVPVDCLRLLAYCPINSSMEFMVFITKRL